jgi:hypothetical protein
LRVYGRSPNLFLSLSFGVARALFKIASRLKLTIR